MQLSAQSNSENTLKVANPVFSSVEIPLAEQSVLRTENPANKTMEKNSLVTDEKIQNPSTLPTENPIRKKTELEDPKKN
jgi:hypothetical protein